MSFPSRIETDRLILRPFQANDLDGTVEILSNWEVTKWLSTNVPFPYTHKDGEEFIALAISDFEENVSFRYAIEDQKTSRLVGNMRVFTLTPETEIGYSLHPDFWGKGIGTEVLNATITAGFSTGIITDFIALTMAENKGSQRILEKVGFVHQGSAPPEYDRCGHSEGCSEFFRLTKDQWKNNNKRGK